MLNLQADEGGTLEVGVTQRQLEEEEKKRVAGASSLEEALQLRDGRLTGMHAVDGKMSTVRPHDAPSGRQALMRRAL